MDIRFQIAALQQHWTPPGGLDRRPREVCLTGEGKALAALAAILLLGALVAGIALEIVARRQAREARVWQQQAVEGEARVTRRWRRGGEQRRYAVAYEFLVHGRTYAGEARLSRTAWEALQAGSVIPVRYLPLDPSVNHAYRQGPNPMPRLIPYVAALGLAAGGALAVYRLRRDWRLMAEGRAALGLITRHSKMQRTSHGTKMGMVAYYEFAQLSGALAKGQTGPVAKPPEMGSTVCVLYDPENPGRNAVYPLSLVKPQRTSR
jgi:hypothetical protein